MPKIERALLSVSDKTGIVDLAKELAANKVQILSTGGTAKTLRAAGIEITDVAEFTGFPEIMDGRVKTLHPKVHGGILARRADPEHRAAASRHGIGFIDLVIVNLYPFRETIARADVSIAEAIENIDIGGPSMIRSAAKNHEDVTVVVSPADYHSLIAEMKANNGSISDETRRRLAGKAYAHTAAYDLAIAAYFGRLTGESAAEFGQPGQGGAAADSREEQMPANLVIALESRQPLRYGENPHQPAALYTDSLRPEQGIAGGQQLQGKELSYNNFLDLDAAWSLIGEFNICACAIIKHTNPCGVAVGSDSREAYQRALATDPVSAFGGIIAFNREVDEAAAVAVKELFVEAIVAPEFSSAAREIFSAKKNLRLITLNEKSEPKIAPGSLLEFETKRISGGYLVQGRDVANFNIKEAKVVTTRAPKEEEWSALDFAWKICKHVKSNAIVYANNGQLVGVGAGQMSRVDSVKFGALKAKLPLAGTVLASDAFFPFRDGLDEAAKHGISAVIQPGGSVRDDEVIAAANEHGIAMLFTGIRHFKH